MSRDSGTAIAAARSALVEGMDGMASRLDDCERVARIMVLTGIAPSELQGWLVSRQQSDGGWASVMETGWCTAALGPDVRGARDGGLSWVESQRLETGGWGATARDALRLPVSGLLLRLHGTAIGCHRDWGALERSWARDLAGSLRLTYKAAFYLMSQTANANRNEDLEAETMGYLIGNANPDGGFAPWRGHPIGSDPWSTGICLVGLCSMPSAVNRDVIAGAAAWLVSTQLKSGHWPCHFIDEGTAYAFWGLSEAEKLLEGS